MGKKIARRMSKNSKSLKTSAFKMATNSSSEKMIKKDDENDKVQKISYKYRQFKDLPFYVDTMLEKYCNNVNEVRLDYMRINKEKSKSMPNFRGFQFCGDIFCLYKIEWFKFPIILQLFPNVESIEVWGNIELTEKTLRYVLAVLVTEINKLINENNNIAKEEAVKMLKLKCIKIDEPEQEELSIKQALKMYESKFNKICWRMYEEDGQLIMTSQE